MIESDTAALDDHVDGIRRRSETAFRAVHELLADDLASFANSLLRDAAMAEDVVQQAFVELVRSAHDLDGDGRSLRAWLFRSVRFGCLDELRRRRRKPETQHAETPDHPAAPHDPVAHLLDPELEQALAALSERARSLVLLRHVVGLSGEEIGAVMNMTRAAVYAALARAERRIRRSMTTVEEQNP